MQSFYKAESQPLEGEVTAGGSVASSSSWYGSFRPKARSQLPPIFSSVLGRGADASSFDKRIRDADVSELLSIVKDGLPRFDEGNLVIAVCTAAKVVDDRSLSAMASNPSWLALLDRLNDAVPRLEPRGLSMVAYALAKMAWNKESILPELARASTEKAADFSSTDVAKICWAFAKLDFIEEALDFWQEMANVVLKQAATARHVELSMISWAFGVAQQGHRAMYAEIASCSLRKMQDLTPQCLANIAVAFARQKISDPELFAAISKRSRLLISDFADFDVTNLCWAQACANHVDHELFHQLATHTVASRYVKRYSAEMASQMCWAYAVAKVQHEQLFAELSDFIARHASVFEVQYVANCAWSLAALGVREDSAWHALARECKGGRLWRYSEDQLSAVCWAFARICWHDAELFQDMIQVASQRLSEFKVQSLINFLSAVIVLSEEDWLGGVQDEHSCQDPKEMLERLMDSVVQELQSADKKLQTEELAMLEKLLDRIKEWKGSRVCTRTENRVAEEIVADDQFKEAGDEVPLSKVPAGMTLAEGFQDSVPTMPLAAPDLRQMPFADWLESIDPSGGMLCYLATVEECYDTVAQIVQTYTLVDKDSNAKMLDPLLFADLGISDVHRPLLAQWFASCCSAEISLEELPGLQATEIRDGKKGNAVWRHRGTWQAVASNLHKHPMKTAFG